jgi:hypothetical protein
LRCLLPGNVMTFQFLRLLVVAAILTAVPLANAAAPSCTFTMTPTVVPNNANTIVTLTDICTGSTASVTFSDALGLIQAHSAPPFVTYIGFAAGSPYPTHTQTFTALACSPGVPAACSSNTFTITVLGPGSPPPTAPSCIAQANPTTVTATGGTVTLSANCSGTAVGNATWRDATNAVIGQPTGAPYQAAISLPANVNTTSRTLNYQLTVCASGSPATCATSTTSVGQAGATVPPPPIPTSPVCSLGASSTTPTVSSAVTLTANCTNSPNGYAWSNCASTTSTCSTTATAAGVQSYSVTATNASGSSNPAMVSVMWQVGAMSTVTVVEYYNTALGHFFITAMSSEITALDTGAFKGWARTGYSFKAIDPNLSTPSGASPVCRFYGLPSAGLDSHFYSASPEECAAVTAKFVNAWELESSNVFQVYLPNLTSGACPAGTQPVYRAWNNRADSNHRYTTDPSVQALMVSRGYVTEGYGNPPVVMCAPQ